MRISNCITCKNLIIDNNTGEYVCPAYPEKIPDELFWVYNPELEGKVCANNTKFESDC